MLQQRQKVLAKAPSTHDPKPTLCAIGRGLFRAPSAFKLTIANISRAAP
jgi:hypothetical protein